MKTVHPLLLLFFFYLFFLQVSSVLSNRTQIEDWICEKAATRRRNNQNLKPFVYPYDLGRSKNWKQV